MSRASLAVTGSVHDLKRDLLLFEKIKVLGLVDFLSGSSDEQAATRADLAFLVEKGIVVPGPARRGELSDAVWSRSRSELSEYEFEYEWEWARLAELNPRTRAELLSSSGNHPAGLISFSDPMPHGAELVVAYAENIFDPGSAVPLLRRPLARSDWRAHESTFILPKRSAPSQHAEVVEVVLSRFPFPGDDVPLEDVLDFAHEETTRRQVEALRLWMSRMALAEHDRSELELELESRLHDFSEHMRCADMRSHDSLLRLAISVPLEVVEELLHARPKKALEALYALENRRANRLEAELNAPGHEIAYVRTAAQRFG